MFNRAYDGCFPSQLVEHDIDGLGCRSVASVKATVIRLALPEMNLSHHR